MGGVSETPAYQIVMQLNNAGRYEESVRLLETEPDTGIHLWLKGWALHHLGRVEEAHAAFQQADSLLVGENLGRMRMDRAVLYGHERRFARAYDLHLQAWQVLRTDPVCHALVLYNLGWQHLSRLQLDQARFWLSDALTAGEAASGDGALERVVTRVGVSTLERLSGNADEALRRARWAQESAGTHRHANMPFRAEAQAHRHLGDLGSARVAQEAAVSRAAEGPYRASERLMLGLIQRQEGERADLEALRPGVMPLDAIRLDLHLADEARRTGREPEALDRLKIILSLDEPYPVHDEAPALRELYAWGRAAGLPLPEDRQGQAGWTAQIQALGVPGLRVGGVSVPVRAGRAFALLVYVAMYGQSALRTLQDDVFPGVDAGQVRARVRSAVAQVNRWLGSPNALSLQGDLVIPDSGWVWQVDASDALAGRELVRGAFLPGFYSGWSGRVQDLLDGQDGPPSS